MQIDEVLKVVTWIEHLETLGFPLADVDYPTYEFDSIADGPTAEAEFRLASKFHRSTTFG